MNDVVLHDQGTLVGFTPVSKPARKWFKAHVHSETWQWTDPMNPTLWVDQRLARDLIDGIINDAGLTVEAGR